MVFIQIHIHVLSQNMEELRTSAEEKNLHFLQCCDDLSLYLPPSLPSKNTYWCYRQMFALLASQKKGMYVFRESLPGHRVCPSPRSFSGSIRELSRIEYRVTSSQICTTARQVWWFSPWGDAFKLKGCSTSREQLCSSWACIQPPASLELILTCLGPQGLPQHCRLDGTALVST